MFENLVTRLKNGSAFLGKHQQLLLTVVLLIVIPLAFLISGQQFLDVSKENKERLEKDRIGLTQDVFVALVRDNINEPEVIQKYIEDIAANNPDVAAFRVSRLENGSIVPIVALDKQRIGVPEVDDDPYRLAAINEDESIIFETHIDDKRHWQAYRSVPNDTGFASVFIYMDISMENIDALFSDRVRKAYFYLTIIIVAILILLIRQVRLIDYGRLYREMQKANKAKDTFLNMIAHELRTPLTAIRGYANLISEKAADEQSRENSRKIEEVSEQLVLTVNDLLDVARIQSGKMEIAKKRIDIAEVINKALDTLRPLADKKGMSLSFKEQEQQLFIVADPFRLQQVFTNLVGNSIKYTEEGSVNVTAISAGENVEIRVKDTGKGISAEDQKQLFSKFFRAEDVADSATVGTGLGMWIAKQLVEEMGGTVDVESIKDVGTHIVITFAQDTK